MVPLRGGGIFQIRGLVGGSEVMGGGVPLKKMMRIRCFPPFTFCPPYGSSFFNSHSQHRFCVKTGPKATSKGLKLPKWWAKINLSSFDVDYFKHFVILMESLVPHMGPARLYFLGALRVTGLKPRSSWFHSVIKLDYKLLSSEPIHGEGLLLLFWILFLKILHHLDQYFAKYNQSEIILKNERDVNYKAPICMKCNIVIFLLLLKLY